MLLWIEPIVAFAWNPAVGIPLAIVGLVVVTLIWLFGQPKKEQGTRRPAVDAPRGERREPGLGDEPIDSDNLSFSALDDEERGHEPSIAPRPAQGELEVGLRGELERLGAALAGDRDRVAPAPLPRPTGHAASIVDALRAPSLPEDGLLEPRPIVSPSVAAPVAAAPAPMTPPVQAPAPVAPKTPTRSDLGRRPAQMPVERIVTLFMVAREGSLFNGADLIVAAEKAGLEFGDMGIYHRLVDGKRELGPIFSVANMLKPGNFDLGRLDALHTPGLSFFMTLPALIPALDAWDAMLPTAQRLAELLDGQVLDEERNALGRQRIAHIRDELRGWDRDHEGKEIIFGR
jgi:cell division protein ZipA